MNNLTFLQSNCRAGIPDSDETESEGGRVMRARDCQGCQTKASVLACEFVRTANICGKGGCTVNIEQPNYTLKASSKAGLYRSTIQDLIESAWMKGAKRKQLCHHYIVGGPQRRAMCSTCLFSKKKLVLCCRPHFPHIFTVRTNSQASALAFVRQP